VKIGIFTDYYLPRLGGTETSIFHQYMALTRAGHEVTIVTAHCEGSGTVDAHKRDIVAIRGWGGLAYKGQAIVLPTRSAWKHVNNLKFDVVHAQTEFGVGMLAVRYARTFHVPLIYTAHTFHSAGIEMMTRFSGTAVFGFAFQRWLSHIRLAPFSSTSHASTAGITHATRAARRMRQFWLSFAASSDYIIAPSTRMKDYVSHYLPNHRLATISNPFEMNARPHHSARVIRCVVIGRLSAEKRVAVAVKAFTLLPTSLRAKIRLDIYGDGPERRRLESLAGDAAHISFHGNVAYRQMNARLSSADILIHPSLGFDNQPMVIAEAVSHGLGIVYCDAFLREGLNHQNSRQFDGTAPDLAQVLASVAKQTSLATMRQASLRASREFRYEQFTQNYQAILDEVAAGRYTKA
jgi:glycosyltransferase involved in cell wall biosynthesis